MSFKKQVSMIVITSLIFMNIHSSLWAMAVDSPERDSFLSTSVGSSTSSSNDSPPLQESPDGSPTAKQRLILFPSPHSTQHPSLALLPLNSPEAATPPKEFNVAALLERTRQHPSLQSTLGWMAHEHHPHNSKVKNWSFLGLGVGISAFSLWGISEVFAEDTGVAYMLGYMFRGPGSIIKADITASSAVLAAALPEVYEMTTVPREMFNCITEPRKDVEVQKKRASRWFALDMAGRLSIAALTGFKSLVQFQILRDAFTADDTSQPSYFYITVAPFLFSQFTKLYMAPERWWDGVMAFLMRGRDQEVRDQRQELLGRLSAASRRLESMDDKDLLSTLMILAAIDESFPDHDSSLASTTSDPSAIKEHKERLETHKRTKEFLFLSLFLDPVFREGFQYKDPTGWRKWIRSIYDVRHPVLHNLAGLTGKALGAVGGGALFTLYQYVAAAQVFKEPADFETGYDPSSSATALGTTLTVAGTVIMMDKLSDQFKRLMDQAIGYQPNAFQEVLGEHVRVHKGTWKDRLTSNEFLSDVLSTAVSAYLTLPLMLQEVHAKRLLQFVETQDYESLGFNEFLPLASFLEMGQQAILFGSLGRSMREALRKVHESRFFNGTKSVEQIVNLSRHKLLEGLVTTSRSIEGLADNALLALYSNLEEVHQTTRGFHAQAHTPEPSQTLPGGRGIEVPLLVQDKQEGAGQPTNPLEGFTLWLARQGIDVHAVTAENQEDLARRYWNLRTRKHTRLFPERDPQIHPLAQPEHESITAGVMREPASQPQPKSWGRRLVEGITGPFTWARNKWRGGRTQDTVTETGDAPQTPYVEMREIERELPPRA